jgi:uncharacterized membrane protein (DUF441 family)
MQSEYLILSLVIIISLIAKNYAVAIASGLLLFLRLLHADQSLELLENYGLTAGIVLLTVGVLAPVAAGKIHVEQISQSFQSPSGVLAIAVGIVVAYFGGRGVYLLKSDPLVITAIITGTVIGVALFRGVAVGPLIAAGITAILQKILSSLWP